MQIGHRKEIRKLTFRTLSLRRSSHSFRRLINYRLKFDQGKFCLLRNHSYENEFRPHVDFRTNQTLTHFNMKVSTRRNKGTRELGNGLITAVTNLKT